MGCAAVCAKFLSTPSARRATRGGQERALAILNFYPRPPRGGRRGCAHGLPLRKNFYPRPPRGGRHYPRMLGVAGRNFYPRPPRGGRHFFPRILLASGSFLSTPSARRATACENHRTRPECYFYPRPPRGGRHGRAGGVLLLDLFLSTPSARRATGVGGWADLKQEISIHALREEGDGEVRGRRGSRKISIHALREEGDCGTTH